jgi:hypothetical protein
VLLLFKRKEKSQRKEGRKEGKKGGRKKIGTISLMVLHTLFGPRQVFH